MHAVEKPHVRRAEEYRRPEGDLDLRTSYAQQYTRLYPIIISPFTITAHRIAPLSRVAQQDCAKNNSK